MYRYDKPVRSDFLDEAAALYRAALKARLDDNRSYPGLQAAANEKTAEKLAELAAIEMGVIPAAMVRDLLDRLTNQITNRTTD